MKFKLKMKNIKKIGATVSGLLAPLSTFAAHGGTHVTLDRSGITALLTTLRDWFAGILGILAVITLLYAAFLFMTAGGDETKRTNAKTVLWYGLIGAGVVILAYGVFTMVASFLQ